MFLGKKSEMVTSLRRIAGSPLSVINYQVRGTLRLTTQAAPQRTRKPLTLKGFEYLRYILSRLPHPYLH
jgi:hypothetical protein